MVRFLAGRLVGALLTLILFISLVFVAINLLWMRFLEAHLSLYVASAISVVIGYLIVRYG